MSTNASNINFSLLLTKFLQLLNLISLQPPRSTRSSSVVTLSRPPTISSLKITDRSFRYASPRLWNQLPDSYRQLHHSCLDSPPHPLLNSYLSSSPLSSSIIPSLFHSRLKTYLFNKSHRRFLFPTGLPHDNGTGLDRTYYASAHLHLHLHLFRSKNNNNTIKWQKNRTTRHMACSNSCPLFYF